MTTIERADVTVGSSIMTCDDWRVVILLILLAWYGVSSDNVVLA